MNRTRAYDAFNDAATLVSKKHDRSYARVEFTLRHGTATARFSLPDEDIAMPQDAGDALESLFFLVSLADSDPAEYADSEGISLNAGIRFVKRCRQVDSKLQQLFGMGTYERLYDIYQDVF